MKFPVILYEDNHLIAVEKPAGLPMEPGGKSPKNLLDEVKSFIKTRDHKPGRVFLGLVHRLDRPVSGVVLFAKTSKAAARLSAQFRLHTVEKIYHALVETGGSVPPKGWQTLEQFITKEEPGKCVRVSENGESKGQKAVMKFCFLKERHGKALVEIKPLTGRPHQIRAGLSSRGFPILGDGLYGSTEAYNKGIALHAMSLSFEHPTTKERVYIESVGDLSEQI